MEWRYAAFLYIILNHMPQQLLILPAILHFENIFPSTAYCEAEGRRINSSSHPSIPAREDDSSAYGKSLQ